MTFDWILRKVKSAMCGRPPLLVFIFCLATFAVVLLCASLYLRGHNVNDLDVHKNWNTFMKNFADMEFCVNGNLTYTNKTQQLSTTESPSTTTASTQNEKAVTLPNSYRFSNYSVKLLLVIRPTVDFLRIPHNMTYLSGIVTGRDLGLKGNLEYEEINVTFTLPVDWNMTQCTRNWCKPIKIITCVLLRAATAIFPESSAPDTCELAANQTVVEYHATMTSHRVWQYKYPFCQNHPKVTLEYNLNPALRVMMSIGDKSIINLHLLHTSYFLFVMMITLFCYAIIRGHPQSKNNIQKDKFSTIS